MSNVNQSQNFHPGQTVMAHGRTAIVAFIANGRTYGHVPGVGVPVDLGRASDFDPCGTEGSERQLELGRTVRAASSGVPCRSKLRLVDPSAEGPPNLLRPTWDPALLAHPFARLTSRAA